jgi:ABC-type antimicrobial peptide transport system permease subunit
VFNRRQINSALKEGGDKVTASSTGLKWRSGLLVVQIALSFVILCIGTMITLSLYRLTTQDAGFSADNVLAVNMDLNFSNYTNATQRRDFAMGLLEGVKALPNVEIASVSGSFPLSNNLLGPVPFEAEIQPLNTDDIRPRANVTIVSEDYHALLNIPLLQGRYFTSDDDESNTQVVIINKTLADQFFGSTNALGQRLSTDNGQSWLTIVGITSNVKSLGLDVADQAAFYIPFRQTPVGRVRVLAKARTAPLSLRDPIVSLVHQLDPQQAIASSQTLADVRQQWLSIGATPLSILNQLLQQTAKLTVVGLLIGLTTIPMVGPLISTFLFRTSIADVSIYLFTSVLLILAAGIATSFPAHKATGVNPATTLRNE